MVIVNNKENQEFETLIDEERSMLQYRIREKATFHVHTGVPDNIMGIGIAFQLAKFGLDYA